MKTRRLSDFVTEQSAKGVKLDRLTPSANVDVATLKQADLDRNGWLSGAAELKAVFAKADGFDSDGNAQTLVSEDALGQKTKAGQLLDAAIGCDITGDGNVILMGQKVWANRHGGRKIKLRSRGLVTQ
jgi:hypothetical protein